MTPKVGAQRRASNGKGTAHGTPPAPQKHRPAANQALRRAAPGRPEIVELGGVHVSFDEVVPGDGRAVGPEQRAARYVGGTDRERRLDRTLGKFDLERLRGWLAAPPLKSKEARASLMEHPGLKDALTRPARGPLRGALRQLLLALDATRHLRAKPQRDAVRRALHHFDDARRKAGARPRGRPRGPPIDWDLWRAAYAGFKATKLSLDAKPTAVDAAKQAFLNKVRRYIRRDALEIAQTDDRDGWVKVQMDKIASVQTLRAGPTGLQALHGVDAKGPADMADRFIANWYGRGATHLRRLRLAEGLPRRVRRP